ncbi:MAG: hypothetical protein JOZ81_26110 [Chloroflexi bacterium]|nr:hypothetical protein [Chloroflexota bacterium]
MSRFDLVRDLDDRDLLVLRDLVRFGALRRRHIDVRYVRAALSARRLSRLEDRKLVKQRNDAGVPRGVFEATRTGARLLRRQVNLKWRSTPAGKLIHDLALVDLAAYWQEEDSNCTWITERELKAHIFSTDPGHRPDGVVVTRGSNIAIEFERSPKTMWHYEHIHRWFARATRIHGIRWYVTTSLIKRRVETAIDRQGLFGLDVEVAFVPKGVEVSG